MCVLKLNKSKLLDFCQWQKKQEKQKFGSPNIGNFSLKRSYTWWMQISL